MKTKNKYNKNIKKNKEKTENEQKYKKQGWIRIVNINGKFSFA